MNRNYCMIEKIRRQVIVSPDSFVISIGLTEKKKRKEGDKLPDSLAKYLGGVEAGKVKGGDEEVKEEDVKEEVKEAEEVKEEEVEDENNK